MKNIKDPGSIEVLEFTWEIASGASQTSPGSLKTVPGQIAPGTQNVNPGTNTTDRKPLQY